METRINERLIIMNCASAVLARDVVYIRKERKWILKSCILNEECAAPFATFPAGTSLEFAETGDIVLSHTPANLYVSIKLNDKVYRGIKLIRWQRNAGLLYEQEIIPQYMKLMDSFQDFAAGETIILNDSGCAPPKAYSPMMW